MSLNRNNNSAGKTTQRSINISNINRYDLINEDSTPKTSMEDRFASEFENDSNNELKKKLIEKIKIIQRLENDNRNNTDLIRKLRDIIDKQNEEIDQLKSQSFVNRNFNYNFNCFMLVLYNFNKLLIGQRLKCLEI